MKYFYFTIVLFISLYSFSQSDILGQWSLQSIIIDGVPDNDIPDQASINFTTNPGDGNGLYLDGLAACNGFGGSYVMTSTNTFDIILFYQTLVICDTQEETLFENKYFYDILYSEADVTSFQYTVSGFGINTTLTLTNTSNNNVAIYSTSPESDLSGEWFLNSINYNGVQLDNYLTPEIGYTLNLNFYGIVETDGNMQISFNGFSGCSAFTGTYIINGSSLTTYDGVAILPEGCLGTPQARYEEKYLDILSNVGENPSEAITYGISGTGTDAILTMTYPNGNFAVYGRTPIFETLFKTWYLTSINDNGTSISIAATDSPSLRLTTSSDAFSRILYDGVGDCNTFSGYYSIYGTNDNSLTIFEFDASPDTCSSSFESLYFDIVANSATNYLTYELINDRQILKLTDLSGRIMYFGDQPINQVILGEWSLHYIEVYGNQQYSTIPNSVNTINFDEDSFNGGVCSNGYFGNYTVNNSNTLDIPSISALTGGCNYPTEIQLFLHPYFWTVLSDVNASSTFTYLISGSGNDETLKITNSNNESAFYGRSPLPENELPGTWYLHSITKDYVVELNVYEPTFNIDFGLTPDSGAGLDYDGLAVCHDYFGSYQLEGLDSLRLNYISYTLDFCQEYGGQFEESYFSFFGAAASGTMLLGYEVSGSEDNETLVLTDGAGDFVTYGRQPLSFPDNELVNRWYLQFININGEQLDNIYNYPSQSLDLDLTNSVVNLSENTLGYQGSSSCNGFAGAYSYTDSVLTFENMAVTLVGCQGEPRGMYESYYLEDILRSDNTLPSVLNYSLTSSGINQTLTLTGSNGDFAVYGKTAPTTSFFTTWYLSSIESNGTVLEISDTATPTINLTSNRYHPIFPGLDFDGQGDCNAFDGDYRMYVDNSNKIKINNFSPASATCNSNYETDYFDILNDANTNEFSFELLDTYQTLRLTDLAGNKLVYGSQPLSVSETTIDNLAIHLKKNPVKEELLLELDEALGNQFSYQIYSVDGKQIMKNRILENNTINVEKLTSGLYFLAVSSQNNFKQTLKFIKE